jgi:hypothetical protein
VPGDLQQQLQQTPWKPCDTLENVELIAQHDRRRQHLVVKLYAALALGWAAFAHWVVAPALIAKPAGGILAFVQHHIQNQPGPFLTRDIIGRWGEYSRAVLIAMALHLTILWVLRRYDLRAAARRPAREVRSRRFLSLVLSIISLVFLGVAALSGPRHDYYFYLRIWYEVARGHDPWFKIFGPDGHVPSNAYGPLFNVLTAPWWVNPYAPKLLFAYAYTLFSIALIKGFAPSRPPSSLQSVVLLALFWNPFAWVEIPIRGHFDILVGLLCLASVRACARRCDTRSGLCLALGVLLKYLPIVLLPFLSLDRGRVRTRLLIVAVAAIAFGLILSIRVWGMSTLLPLDLAANRSPAPLSIFWFLGHRYSPLRWLSVTVDGRELAPFVLFLALLGAWAWAWIRQPDIEAAAVVATTITVLLYRAAHPQYQMVPFVLGSSWVVRHWGSIRGQPARVVAIACYFGWLAAFDLYYAFVNEETASALWYVVKDLVGLPSFLCGCAFLAAVLRSAAPGHGGTG